MSRLEKLAWGLVTLQWALTTAHHWYGGVLFATRWRLEGLVLGLIAWAVAAALWGLGRRRASVWVSAGFFGGLIGVYEGLYNHVLKLLLYGLDASPGLLRAMFPPPLYEPPGDLIFELSGAAQGVVGFALLWTAHRLLGARSRAEVKDADDPGPPLSPQASQHRRQAAGRGHDLAVNLLDPAVAGESNPVQHSEDHQAE